MTDILLTSFAAGGGCACKIPPGELESLPGFSATLAGLAAGVPPGAADLAAGFTGADFLAADDGIVKDFPITQNFTL